MQLRDDNTADTVQFGGEQFDRSQDNSRGNLLEEIDFKRKKMDYYKNIFSAELAAVPRKRKSILSSLIVNIALMIVVSLVLFYISSKSFLGLPLFFATIIFVIYMITRLIRYIRIYLINIDTGYSKKYRIKHGVNTLVNEEEYCTKILAGIPIYLDKLSDIESRIVADEDIDVAVMQNELDKIPSEFEDFRYTAGSILF